MNREILSLGMAYYKNIIPDPKSLIKKIEDLEIKRSESNMLEVGSHGTTTMAEKKKLFFAGKSLYQNLKIFLKTICFIKNRKRYQMYYLEH